jgi:hypothetical protein
MWPTTALTLSDLPCTVRGRPLVSAGVCGGCYSVGYSRRPLSQPPNHCQDMLTVWLMAPEAAGGLSNIPPASRAAQVIGRRGQPWWSVSSGLNCAIGCLEGRFRSGGLRVPRSRDEQTDNSFPETSLGQGATPWKG